MKRLISDFSSNLDLFNLPISLFYQGRKKRFTTFGVCLSLLIYAFLIYNFFQSDFYQKTNPIIVSQNKKYPHAPRITFDESKIIVVSVLNNDGNAVELDPAIASFQFYVLREQVNETTTKYEYVNIDYKNLHHCTINDTNNDTVTWNLLNSPENGYCLDEKSFGIEGGWNENIVEFVYIVLNACNNATFNGKCKSPQEAAAWFDTPRLISVQHHNTRVDFFDHENPIKVEYLNDFPQLNYWYTKKDIIYMKQVELSSDEGWLFPSIRKFSDFMFDFADTDILERINEKNIFLKFINSQFFIVGKVNSP